MMKKSSADKLPDVSPLPMIDKALEFSLASRAELLEMPEQIRRRFGFQLRQVQKRETPEGASQAEGSIGNEVMKLRENYDGNTYRCVYAAKFEKAVYVLHVFMKKSKSGISTPQAEIELVRSRLQAAKAHYAAHYEQVQQPEQKAQKQ